MNWSHVVKSSCLIHTHTQQDWLYEHMLARTVVCKTLNATPKLCECVRTPWHSDLCLDRTQGGLFNFSNLPKNRRWLWQEGRRAWGKKESWCGNEEKRECAYERGWVCVRQREGGRVLPVQPDQCFGLRLAMWITLLETSTEPAQRPFIGLLGFFRGLSLIQVLVDVCS